MSTAHNEIFQEWAVRVFGRVYDFDLYHQRDRAYQVGAYAATFDAGRLTFDNPVTEEAYLQGLEDYADKRKAS